jgi:hypothetical protein
VAGDRLGGPRTHGGDTRSGRIEAHGPAILAMVGETPDITRAEIVERLEQERGERFAPSTIHRYFRRHGWSFKKSPPTPASRTAKMSPQRARLVQGPAGSGSGSADLHRRDPGSGPGQALAQNQDGSAAGPRSQRRTPASRRPARTLAHHHPRSRRGQALRRRAQALRHRHADADRRRDRRRELPRWSLPPRRRGSDRCWSRRSARATS